MTAMTLAELIELEHTLGGNDNIKIVLLVGRTAGGLYQVVQVDADGKVVTTA